ncbi:glycosyltransferase [Enemella sp. A6]|uniref:glycosyltransferase n=1 Tax=Enemella sp. A6 TaxID=3440152 RepID=UPI003EB7359E
MPQTTSAPDPRFAISVVIPVYRSVATIERCLQSLLDQTLDPARFEIITILNGPEDGSRELIERLAAAHPGHTLQRLDSPVASAGAARNVGLDHVRGAHVTFVDADDWVSRNYLAELLKAADNISLPVAGLIDVAPDGTQNTETTINRSLTDSHGRLLGGTVSLAGISACKLLPSAWLSDHRFNETLRSGEDLEFMARVFAPYARRYTSVVTEPFHAGARYYRRLTPSSVSRQSAGYEFDVTQRIEVLRELLGSEAAYPDEQSMLTELLVNGQTNFIRRHIEAYPEDLDRLRDDLVASGLPADVAPIESGEVSLDYSAAWAPTKAAKPRQFLVMAGSARSLNQLSRELRILHSAGHRVRLAYFNGSLSKQLSKFPNRRFALLNEPVTGGKQGRWQRRAARVKRLTRRALPLLVPASLASGVLPRVDGGAREYLKQGTVITADREGSTLARKFGLTPAGGAELLDAWVLHSMARVAIGANNLVKAVPAAAERLAKNDTITPPPPPVWSQAAWRLVRVGQSAAASTVLDAAATVHSTMGEHGADVIRVLGAIQQDGVEPDSLMPAVRATLAAADQAWEVGETSRATFLGYLVLDVLTHPDLHASVPAPPLMDPVNDRMAPFEQSLIGRHLTAPLPERIDVGSTGKVVDGVLILPGAYPKFAEQLLDALGADVPTRVLSLASAGRQFTVMGLNPIDVSERLAVVGGETGLSLAAIDLIKQHRTIFADWADSGAMAASWFVEPGTRLFIRFHGVDSLSGKQFLIDWSRVTDVVFVSEHLRRTAVQVLGERIAHCRQHVIGNMVNFDRFDRPVTDDAHRRLGMVGWGQRVKDPLWAVEVLAHLVKHDPAWSLRLIGSDFPVDTIRTTENEYATRFRERILEPDVSGHIEFIGYTKDLPTHLAGVGFAVSSSLRESFHVGAVEMVASTAVPVIRDWPVYARLGGAADVFGEHWVVQTPQEAAERILQVAERDVWLETAEQAAAEARAHYGGEGMVELYRALLRDA